MAQVFSCEFCERTPFSQNNSDGCFCPFVFRKMANVTSLRTGTWLHRRDEMKIAGLEWDVSVISFIEIVRNIWFISFLVHINYFFSIFVTDMLKIDHPSHQVYNFVTRESYVLGNFKYWSCAKVNICGSTEPRKFLPYLQILLCLSLYIIYTI